MSSAERAPTGLARRRQRLSDQETEQRMLTAAMAMVADAGLTVSLEHISFEDVIRDAGVSRSAVYRRWPYKDLFFSDLLRQLATAAGAGALPLDEAAGELLWRVAEEHEDWLEAPELRHELLVELLRQSGEWNFRFFHESAQWRTYLALHATFLSLPSGELRDDVQSALTRSEERVVAQIADSYREWAGLLGYRLRPDLAATFETMAGLLNATMRGLVLMAPSIPDVATYRVVAAPFGVATEAEWSQPALGITAAVLSFLEPDPDVDWTAERVAEARTTVRAQGAGGPAKA